MNPQVDLFIANGCGRCVYHATPHCKVRLWREELETLRQLVLECGLTEELKWGFPCYTAEGKNILIVGAFKDYCSISFFKGSLLDDGHNILEKPGENAQAARLRACLDFYDRAKSCKFCFWQGGFCSFSKPLRRKIQRSKKSNLPIAAD